MSQKYSVQHLSGTTAEWQATTYVIPKDEIVVEYTTDDTVLLKIGDGQHLFSDLPYIETIGGEGGSGGTYNHSLLTNRDAANQHPISAIQGLSDVLSSKYSKPSSGIPASDLSNDVQSSLELADSALQSAPVTSVNGQTGDVALTIPDVSGKLNINQGVANAGKVMTVDSSGNIVPVTPSSSGDPVQITIGDVDGLQDALNGKESLISAGTTAQYLRGDKTWQTLNKSAVGLGNVPNVTTNNQTPTYSAASTRTDLTSGETLATALGKIKKWLGDLGALAFKSSVSKTDLESAIQTSLDRADSALQSHQSLAAYRTAAAQDLIDAGKQTMLTAGANITIADNVISATGGGIGSDTLTTKGDLLIRNTSGISRLAIGTTGQVLTAVNGLPAWQDLETYDGDVEYLTAYAGGVH